MTIEQGQPTTPVAEEFSKPPVGRTFGGSSLNEATPAAANKKSFSKQVEAGPNMSQETADTINRGKMADPKENYSSNAMSQPFIKKEREKKPVEGQSAGIKGTYNNLSETFNRGRDGKVLDDKFVAETDALKGLHAERAAAVTAKADSDAIKIIDDKIANATKALEPKTKAFGELTMPQRTAASIGGNFGKNVSNIEKGIRGAGAVVGLGSIISGTKQLISPEVDENGERKSGVGKQLGKIAGGAAIVYASLVHGGANKAMGFAKV